MHTGMVAAERTPVRPIGGPAGAAALQSVLKELRTARQVVNGLALRAYDQLDGEGMYDLAAAEGLIAGAILKIEAAGGVA